MLFHIYTKIYIQYKMGWINKKKDSGDEIPPLPDLPELPEINDDDILDYAEKELGEKEEVNKLPRFPSNSTGDKFSQDAIKDAISGKKEGDNEEYADDLPDYQEAQMTQRPLRPLQRPN